jgi:hypothetical protein
MEQSGCKCTPIRHAWLFTMFLKSLRDLPRTLLWNDSFLACFRLLLIDVDQWNAVFSMRQACAVPFFIHFWTWSYVGL